MCNWTPFFFLRCCVWTNWNDKRLGDLLRYLSMYVKSELCCNPVVGGALARAGFLRGARDCREHLRLTLYIYIFFKFLAS